MYLDFLQARLTVFYLEDEAIWFNMRIPTCVREIIREKWLSRLIHIGIDGHYARSLQQEQELWQKDNQKRRRELRYEQATVKRYEGTTEEKVYTGRVYVDCEAELIELQRNLLQSLHTEYPNMNSELEEVIIGKSQGDR